MKDKNNIGNLFKNAFSKYTEQPDERVWNAIQQSGALKPVKNPWYAQPLSWIAAVAVVTLAVWMIWPGETEEQGAISENAELIQHKSETRAADENQKNASLPEAEDISPEQEQPQNTFITEDSPSSGNKLNTKEAADEFLEETEPLPSGTLENIQNTYLPDAASNILTDKENADRYTNDQAPEPENQLNAPQTDIHEVINISYSEDLKICKGEKAMIYAAGGATYHWSNGKVEDTLIVNPEITTVYNVSVTDANGSFHVGSIKVEVVNCSPLFVPNAFTPDGDGLNDVFKPKGTEIYNYNLQIVTRAGQVIFTSDMLEIGWDGYINGTQANTGVYFYQIRYEDAMGKSHTLSGQLYLYR